MQVSNNKNSTTALILTLVFPFGGLIYTLRHWREKWAKNTFWLACIYIGAVLIYWPEGTVLGDGADGGRYVLQLLDMYGSSLTVQSIISGFMVDQGSLDLYQPLMTYFISRFTDNGHVLFAAFAFVFGFFYSRNIWYVLEKLPDKKLGKLFILVTLYFLISPITNVNGVRMWTALHVFVYALLPYLLERKRSKLWLILLTPLIHFSFLYISVFALAFFLVPYRLKTESGIFLTLAYVLFVVTLFVNSLNLDEVNGVLAEYSPESYEARIDGYVNQNYLDANKDRLALNNWYVKLSGNITHWGYSILLLLILPCMKRNFKNEYGLMHLYVFALLIGSFANISALIPSGGRFQLVSQMFKVPLILLVVSYIPQNDNFHKVVNIALLFLLLPLAVEFRKIFDFLGITAILGNFITVFFWETNIPLIEYLKQLL